MDHVLATLKKENPGINRAFYDPDNAGCYDAAYTILACKKSVRELVSAFNVWTFQIPRAGRKKNRAIYFLQP